VAAIPTANKITAVFFIASSPSFTLEYPLS